MADREKVIGSLEVRIISDTDAGYSTIEIPVNEAERILALLKEQEAVVRCKDCINCIKEPNGELYCDILAVGYEPLGSKKVTEDWFCADGERKEGH